ncbi:uncharacterized protein JCM10292_003861 [Rhodotorula paludigena]|uniref:uncharacterized protein n=1 Tax=Rhodotorula paludigena TaxID=86838 RepID=UPI00317FF201
MRPSPLGRQLVSSPSPLSKPHSSSLSPPVTHHCRCTPTLSTLLSTGKCQRRIYLPLGNNGEPAVAHLPLANNRAGFVMQDVNGPRIAGEVLCGCCGIFMEVNFSQSAVETLSWQMPHYPQGFTACKDKAAATSVPSTNIRLLHVVYGWYQTLKKDLKSFACVAASLQLYLEDRVDELHPIQAQLLRLLREYGSKKRTMSLLLPLRALLEPVFSASRDEHVVITANSINKVVDARYPTQNDDGIKTRTACKTAPA